MKGKVLIVDDDADLRKVLRALLEGDYQVSEAESGAVLQKLFGQDQPDVVLLDVKLPDSDGLELLPQIKKMWPETEVIVLTGCDDISLAVEAGKRGAYNFVTKPFDTNKLLADVKCALERKEQNEENSALRRALETMSGVPTAVFQSAAMREVVRTVERIARSDVAILITGESGTGKEVIADLVHAFSTRSKGRIIKINCAALPRELIESELFGSVKGAFTGAHSDREGLFRQAEGGSLFLDEISEMPWIRKANCFACCRTRKSGRWAARRLTRPTAASLPPPIANPRKPSRTASCGRTFITASAPFRFICRRCASGGRTSCRWPTRF
jgi:DNA-binding NtrC family response regulator